MSGRSAARFVPPLLLACAVTPPGTLLAQRSVDRGLLMEWEARVDSSSVVTELQPLLDSAVSKQATGGKWPLGFLRRGLVKRRLGELTENRRYFDEALEEFWAVVLEHRDWPYAWYGLGSTKLAMAALQLLPYPDEHQPDGSTYAEEAGVALTRALEADSTFGPAKLALAQAVSPAESSGPGALLAVAHLRREAGDLDSTVVLLGRYLQAGGDSGVGFLELARAHFEAGRVAAGADAYYAAVARARSAEARRGVRDDLAWIMDSADLETFDHTPASELPSSIEAFWERRDVRDLRLANERLAEHYRRLAYAERHFLRVGDRLRHTQGQRYRPHQTRLDDRAVIYVRHGEPDARASFGTSFPSAGHVAPQIAYNPDGLGADDSPGGFTVPRPDDATPPVPPNLSWKYQRPDGNLVFHFVAEFGSDYRLIESLLDVFSIDTVIQLQMSNSAAPGQPRGPAFDPARFAHALIQSRSELDPVYARLAQRPSIQGSSNLQLERAAGQRSLEIGTRTDSYVQKFRASLESTVQAYGVSRNGEGRVLVVFGVPRPRGAADGVTSFPLSVRLVVSSEHDRRLVQADTTIRLQSSGAPGGRQLAGYLELPAPPGRHRLRVLLADSTNGAGGAAQIEPIVLSDADDPAIALSDLILGVPGGLLWPAPDGPVALNPSGRFRAAPAALYYRIGGLQVDSMYQTTVEIRSDKPGGRRRTAAAFAMKAEGGTEVVRRGIDLRGLGSGPYLLVVTVTGAGGMVTSSRGFRVK
ncbi:MAG TPA: GWxTD domain-containing protein [Gemmatimonadales bacterium]|nr:GWxTD domain-containing protein [Gemmatimonadales bacterium]